MLEENINPIVTIIMATYNRDHLIGESLNYIQEQSFKDFECLIIDDGSTDNTSEIVPECIKGDKRFRYLLRKEKYKKGLSGCRNYGLDIAKGDFIIFFDDDDIVHPQNLMICTILLLDGKNKFCNYQKESFYSDLPEIRDIDIDKITSQKYGLNKIEDFITGKYAMASCTVLWQKECFDNIRFIEELNYGEEWECYSRILLRGISGITINEVLYYNRKHPNSNTGEFSKGSRKRINSLAKAAKIIIDNLSKHGKLNYKLEKFFIRLSFQINDYTILKKIFSKSSPSIFKRLKYSLGFMFYPIIKPIFNVKGKLSKY